MKRVIWLIVVYIVSAGNGTWAFNTKDILYVRMQLEQYVIIVFKNKKETVLLDFYGDDKRCHEEFYKLTKEL